MQLTTDSVTKSFAGVHALSDVSVRIAKGEIVGLIGPNGSGKSTLVNVISGVIEPTSGTIRLGDDEWSRRPSHRVARCGVARTFQTARPQFVLLDEPAAGLNESESDELLETLLKLRDELGFGTLLIDHDLRLIMRGTDRIYVLNEGKMLAEGNPDDIRHDRRVIAAYLGTDANGTADHQSDEKETRAS
jgi:branched-chain amino acid transport system ATP-binding protein